MTNTELLAGIPGPTNRKSNLLQHSTSLGCPYKCSFCMINIINRTDVTPGVTSDKSNSFRWWSPDFVIKQFDYFAEQGVTNIKIADELFVFKPKSFFGYL